MKHAITFLKVLLIVAVGIMIAVAGGYAGGLFGLAVFGERNPLFLLVGLFSAVGACVAYAVTLAQWEEDSR